MFSTLWQQPRKASQLRKKVADASRRAVDETLDAFRDKPAGLGRARMYGEASKGLDDPGMLAVKRMLQGLLD